MRKTVGQVLSFSALYLLVNIDPGENAFPAREQELETNTPEVADKFFRLAFGARKLGVVNKLNSHSSLADSTWKCNRLLFEKHFVWGPVTERLTRPVI